MTIIYLIKKEMKKSGKYTHTSNLYNFIFTISDVYIEEKLFAIGYMPHNSAHEEMGTSDKLLKLLSDEISRRILLETEGFRLATFSLFSGTLQWVSCIELARSGFFCDKDGRIKCFSCCCVYNPEDAEAVHYELSCGAIQDTGETIADNYGANIMVSILYERAPTYMEDAVYLRNETAMERIRLGNTTSLQQTMQESQPVSANGESVLVSSASSSRLESNRECNSLSENNISATCVTNMNAVTSQLNNIAEPESNLTCRDTSSDVLRPNANADTKKASDAKRRSTTEDLNRMTATKPRYKSPDSSAKTLSSGHLHHASYVTRNETDKHSTRCAIANSPKHSTTEINKASACCSKGTNEVNGNRDFASEHSRIISFLECNIFEQTPQEMALAGQFYTGQGDITECYRCSGRLGGWEKDDDPVQEHAKWYPHCSLSKQNKKE